MSANDEYCAACGFAAGTTRFQYAGFWLRVFALAIDALVIMAPATLCIVVFRPILAPLSWEHPGMTRLCLRICGILIGWLYSASMESSSYQATVGKAVFGLRVTDLRGQRITFARATGRYFGKFLSGMFCMLGYLMAGLTERKQALHDMLAETEVVRFQE